MIAVDSSVWIDRILGKSSVAVEKLGGILEEQIIIVGDIVLMEVLQGCRDDLHARRLGKLMAQYQSASMLNREIAVQGAANFRLLRSKGITIRKTPDLIIGTWCIENDCPLLHSDRDFLPMVEHLGLREF